MLELSGKPGDLQCKIRFSARRAFRGNPKAPSIERELVYGHVCPTCNNVIQAFFLTDQPVDLWMYEETVFVSSSQDRFGTELKTVPNNDSKFGYSQYTSTFLRTAQGNAQHLVLKNHIVRFHGIDAIKHTSDRFFEPGGNVCPNTGCFSLRPKLCMQDLILLFKGGSFMFKLYNFPDTLEALEEKARLYDIRLLPAYGKAPPVMTFPQTKLRVTSTLTYQIYSIYEPFTKKEVTQ